MKNLLLTGLFALLSLFIGLFGFKSVKLEKLKNKILKDENKTIKHNAEIENESIRLAESAGKLDDEIIKQIHDDVNNPDVSSDDAYNRRRVRDNMRKS